jgi:hypothetical protein
MPEKHWILGLCVHNIQTFDTSDDFFFECLRKRHKQKEEKNCG